MAAAVSAARLGHVACLMALGDAGVPLERAAVVAEGGGLTPFAAAAEAGHVACLAYLHAHCGGLLDVNAPVAVRGGRTALALAAARGHAACVAFLCDHGARDDGSTPTKLGATFAAVVGGSVACLRLICARGAVSPRGLTDACAFVASRGTVEQLRVLAEHGADLNAPFHHGPAVIAAAYQGNVKCLEYLAARGDVDLDAVTAKGVTAVSAACERGDAKCLEVLARHGASLAQFTGRGRAPIHVAVEFGHAECIAVLHAHGVNVDTPARDGNTPLGLAVAADRDECIRMLHRCGAGLERPAPLYSPSQLALQSNRIVALRSLLSCGANPNARNRGMSILAVAIGYCREEALRMLLESGADPFFDGGADLANLVSYACAHATTTCLDLLHRYGVDVARVAMGQALQYSRIIDRVLERDRAPILKALLNYGLDLRSVSLLGETLSHAANQSPRCLRVLHKLDLSF